MLHRLYDWYGKRVVLSAVFVVVMLILTGIFLSTAGIDTAPEDAETEMRGVSIASVAELSARGSIELVGSVEAVSRAHIQSEVSGRVTHVHVELSDQVAAGQVIAELENASERAAVLQAEGAYEAAVAGAAQSDVSVVEAQSSFESAQKSAVNTYRSAFTTVDGTVSNLIDEFFSGPDSGIIGFRLEGPTQDVNMRRVALRSVLEQWNTNINSTDESNISERLVSAREHTVAVAELLDLLANAAADEDNENATIAGNTMTTQQGRLASARTSINGTLESLESARSTIVNAAEALERIELGGTATEVSSANAQVKQALGSLRAAQARLADTVFRSPISGTINQLAVKQGDFIGSFERIATIANNGAFLITAYISESDRGRIVVGDTVSIEGGTTGRVTNIAPAVDPSTKKIEVQIQAEAMGLSNGDTVRVAIAASDDGSPGEDITIPVSALKVETDRMIVFTVSAEDALVAHEINEGPLLGENIVIESGITPDMWIVRDARGLNEGDTVRVID